MSFINQLNQINHNFFDLLQKSTINFIVKYIVNIIYAEVHVYVQGHLMEINVSKKLSDYYLVTFSRSK